MIDDVQFSSGIDLAELRDCLRRGTDPSGNPIQPMIAEDDGWSLRCCLDNARAGESIAIISWSPFPWDGPYRESGPVVVHADGCDGVEPSNRLPDLIDARPMVLRPYTRNRAIAYHRVRQVGAEESVAEAARDVLRLADVDFVHGRNVCGGCFAFVASRPADRVVH